MKKVLLALALAATLLMMAACNAGTTSSSKVKEPPESQPTSSEVSEVSSEESSTPLSEPDTSSATSVVSSEVEDSEYYFKDNVIVSEHVKIEITDYKVIEPGEEGNPYGAKPVIAFWYNITNLSGMDLYPSLTWSAMCDAYQDNDPNTLTRLESARMPDDRFMETQLNPIKKDGTVANAAAYELSDTTTPVTLKTQDAMTGEDLGEQIFELK